MRHILCLSFGAAFFFYGNRGESVLVAKGMREGEKDLFVKPGYRTRHERLKKHGSVELQLFVDLHF